MEINLDYQNQMKEINKTFSDEKVVTLFKLFIDYVRVKEKISGLNLNDNKDPLVNSYRSLELNQSFFNQDFIEFISLIVGEKIKEFKKITAYQLSWRDYEIIHDKKNNNSTYELILNFTNNWRGEWGGSIFYVDGKGNYIKVPNGENSLTIINKGNKLQRYIEYVNHHALNEERLFVIAEF